MGQAKLRRATMPGVDRLGAEEVIPFLRNVVGDPTLPHIAITSCTMKEIVDWIDATPDLVEDVKAGYLATFVEAFAIGTVPHGCVLTNVASSGLEVLRPEDVTLVWVNSAYKHWYHVALHELTHSMFARRHVLRCPLMNGIVDVDETNMPDGVEMTAEQWNVIARAYQYDRPQPNMQTLTDLYKKYYRQWKENQ